MDDMGAEDPVAHYIHLGSVFFAIAIVVWTSVAVWLCYSSPSAGESEADGETRKPEGLGDLSDSMVGKVASSFAELLLESKDNGGRKNPLDLSKLEGLLAKVAGTTAAAKADGAGAGAVQKKGQLGSLENRRDGCPTGLSGLNLGAIGSSLAAAAGVGRDADKGGADAGQKPATMLSMAEHARDIGNKYLQDRHFAAAAHCYEVACLLLPVGNGGSGQLAAYHCNCALACLELGRYGDAVNEGNAALVLTPPKHIAVKALYRLAVAHANLKNAFEARRCLKRCLQLDPLNEYVRIFVGRLGDEEASSQAAASDDRPSEGCQLGWVDFSKRVQCPATATRVKSKKTKLKNGFLDRSEAQQLRLDREAALSHSVARYNNKLYILGGWADGASASSGGKAEASLSGLMGGGRCGGELCRGTDELHVLDMDSLEFRQLVGPNTKPPYPCCCHSATMVGTNMFVFGGLGPPVDQPPMVMVFDVAQGKWRVPRTSGIPPRQRQGHTANAVQGDRHLCIFGGIEPTGEPKVARIYNDTHLLDLQTFSWRKLEVVGRRPPARFGHTTTNLPGSSSRLLVFGGRDHLGGAVPTTSAATPPSATGAQSAAEAQAVATSSSPSTAAVAGGCCAGRGDPALGGLTGLHILDVERRLWLQQPYTGAPPQRAFYHTASLLDDSTLVVVGSGAALGTPQDIAPLYLLDLEAWRWSNPQPSGIGPAPRIGHAAAAVGMGRVFIFGGAVKRDGQASIDKGFYVLESIPIRPKADKDAQHEVAAPVSSGTGGGGAKAAPAVPTGTTPGKGERRKDERAPKGDVKAAVLAEQPHAENSPSGPVPAPSSGGGAGGVGPEACGQADAVESTATASPSATASVAAPAMTANAAERSGDVAATKLTLQPSLQPRRTQQQRQVSPQLKPQPQKLLQQQDWPQERPPAQQQQSQQPQQSPARQSAPAMARVRQPSPPAQEPQAQPYVRPQQLQQPQQPQMPLQQPQPQPQPPQMQPQPQELQLPPPAQTQQQKQQRESSSGAKGRGAADGGAVPIPAGGGVVTGCDAAYHTCIGAASGTGRGASTASMFAPISRDEQIEMMLKDSGFDEAPLDDEPELSFEELLAQEKAFFKAQSEKLSFPRAKEKRR